MDAHACVRISCGSHAEARELALRLEARGYAAAVRRWKTVVITAVGRQPAPQHPYAPRVQRVSSMTPAASTLWPWA